MSNRLNKFREQELQPKRINFAVNQLKELGIAVDNVDSTSVKFNYKESVITFYPYSGWHTGKTIKDGRGWENLKKQLINP